MSGAEKPDHSGKSTSLNAIIYKGSKPNKTRLLNGLVSRWELRQCGLLKGASNNDGVTLVKTARSLPNLSLHSHHLSDLRLKDIL